MNDDVQEMCGNYRVVERIELTDPDDPEGRSTPYLKLENEALIGSGAVIGKNVTIGFRSMIDPNCTVADGVEIGIGVRLECGVRIGEGSSIGHSTTIGCESTVGEDCVIGTHCFIGAGNVIPKRVKVNNSTTLPPDTLAYLEAEELDEV